LIKECYTKYTPYSLWNDLEWHEIIGSMNSIAKSKAREAKMYDKKSPSVRTQADPYDKNAVAKSKDLGGFLGSF